MFLECSGVDASAEPSLFLPLAAHEMIPMRTFLVSYDLAKPDMNQPYLTDAIMALGDAWARPLENVWYIRTDRSESDIGTRLNRLLDDNDGLLIQETRGDAVLTNTGIRWFRRRQRHAGSEADNVVAFPMAATHATDTPATPYADLEIRAAS
jgi:hypothetical protein